MTPPEANRLLEELDAWGGRLEHERSGMNAAFARVLVEQAEIDPGARTAVAWMVQEHGSVERWQAAQVGGDGLDPADAPRRARYAEAVRVAMQSVREDTSRFERFSLLRWDERDGLVVRANGIPVRELFEALARVLQAREVPIATMRELIQQALPDVDPDAVGEAVAYVRACLRDRTPDDEDNSRDPAAEACAYAQQALDGDVFWSVCNEISPFGNDYGWDLFQLIASARIEPAAIEAKILDELRTEWEFRERLPTHEPPDTRAVAIAQALVAGAFASIVLWGKVTESSRSHGLDAIDVLSRAWGPGEAAAFRAMAEALAAAPAA